MNIFPRHPAAIVPIFLLPALVLCLLPLPAFCQEPPPSPPANPLDQPNQILPPTQIPPELLNQLTALARQPGTPSPSFPTLSRSYRLFLILLAAFVLLFGQFLCRRLITTIYFSHQPTATFILFALFVSLAALLIAAAAIGCLFLHLAATICTLASGFAITLLLMPNFSFTRRWLWGKSQL